MSKSDSIHKGARSEVELYTVHNPCQGDIVEYKGIIVVNKVKTRNCLSDWITGWRACCGGEMTSLTKLTEVTRYQLLDETAAKARSMGANAVVGLGFETNTIFDGMLDMVVSGTAVVIARRRDDS